MVGVWQGLILSIWATLKTTFCKYWILTKTKVSIACVSTEYENKKKDTAAMTTVKHDVSNGKLHENCYSQGEYLLVRLLCLELWQFQEQGLLHMPPAERKTLIHIMFEKIFQIYRAQITGKCICKSKNSK